MVFFIFLIFFEKSVDFRVHVLYNDYRKWGEKNVRFNKELSKN